MNEHAKTSKPGVVDKLIKPQLPDETEKAQISIEDADPLYKEIRIDNDLADENGKQVKLKPGSQVTVTVEADSKETLPQGQTK
jgi:hypothetical protein